MLLSHRVPQQLVQKQKYFLEDTMYSEIEYHRYEEPQELDFDITMRMEDRLRIQIEKNVSLINQATSFK